MNNQNNSRLKSFFWGTVFGAAAGAFVTLLYLPETGDDLRRQIKEKGKKAKIGVKKILDQSQDLANAVKEGWENLSELTTPQTAAPQPQTDRAEKQVAKSSKIATGKRKSASIHRPKNKPRFFKGI